jgi:predicted Zn finger-like uncharacterized protein
MNIRCPQCQTTFRVSAERVPAGGARARCARCGATFVVKPAAAERAAAVAPAAQAATGSSAQTQPAPIDARRAPPTPQRERIETGQAGVSPFGARDPHARAERLARALISDIVAYYPDRRDQSLMAGTLRTEFREEILKSWEEYVAQVGLPLAKSTPYFRDALNKILAKGQAIF